MLAITQSLIGVSNLASSDAKYWYDALKAQFNLVNPLLEDATPRTLGVDLAATTDTTVVNTSTINSGYPDSWLKMYEAASKGFRETDADAMRAEIAKYYVAKVLGDEQRLVLEGDPSKKLPNIFESTPIACAKDPDGPLVPLARNPAPRTFAAQNHDFIAALYRPYTPPV